jgi:hypothetical protein
VQEGRIGKSEGIMTAYINVSAASLVVKMMNNTDIFAKLSVGVLRFFLRCLVFYSELSAHAPQHQVKFVRL